MYENEEDRIVSLIDEEGEIFYFVLVDCFKVEKQEYAIMVPLSEDEVAELLEAENEDDGVSGEDGDVYLIDEDNLEDENLEDEEDLEEEEAVIFRLDRDDAGETSFELIEDEEEWEKVSTIAFERLYRSGE